MTATNQRRSRRALVIEDELDHCEMIEECLRRGGHDDIEVVFAHTVRDACAIIAAERFDFVLLDHNLPDGNGSHIVHGLRPPRDGHGTSDAKATATTPQKQPLRIRLSSAF